MHVKNQGFQDMEISLNLAFYKDQQSIKNFTDSLDKFSMQLVYLRSLITNAKDVIKMQKSKVQHNTKQKTK